MKKYILIAILYCVSCSNRQDESFKKTDISKDFISEDKNTQVKYFDNGRLKSMSVTTKIIVNEESLESIYTIQYVEFDSDGTLKKVSIEGEEGISFFYYKDVNTGEVSSEYFGKIDSVSKE